MLIIFVLISEEFSYLFFFSFQGVDVVALAWMGTNKHGFSCPLAAEVLEEIVMKNKGKLA